MLERGARVIMQGLKGRADLNGISARVVTYIEEKGRYKLQVDKTGESVSIKPENVVESEDVAAEEPTIIAPAKPKKSSVKMNRKLTHNAAAFRPEGVKQVDPSSTHVILFVDPSVDILRF